MAATAPFKLERYFAKYEFNTRYLLSPSDCQSLSMADLVGMADAETRRLWENLSLGYTESLGHPLLLAEICSMYPGLAAGNLIEFVPEEAIYVAMHSLLQPGDEVISVSPAYQSLYEIARSIGAELNPWAFTLQNGRWALDLDWLKQAITPRTKLLVVNFPHNPTGYLPTPAEFKEIIAIADRHGLHLFCDEMYRCLEYSPADRLPPAATLYERAISLSGLSKAFALPGLRVGWLATADRSLMDRLRLMKDYTTICASAPSEILAIIALRHRDALANRCLEIIRANLASAVDFFTQFSSQFDWIPPLAGSVCFPRLRSGGPVDDFCTRLVETYNIMLVPGSMFEFPGSHFRLGLGRTIFNEALGVLRQALRENNPQK